MSRARESDEGRRRAGRYTKARVLWTQMPLLELIVYQRRQGDDDLPTGWEAQYPDLDEIGLTLRRTNRAAINVSLTHLTGEELDAFEHVVTTAINQARPIVAELDQRAEKEFQDGNDSDPRLYRPVPRIHERPREE